MNRALGNLEQFHRRAKTDKSLEKKVCSHSTGQGVAGMETGQSEGENAGNWL